MRTLYDHLQVVVTKEYSITGLGDLLGLPIHQTLYLSLHPCRPSFVKMAVVALNATKLLVSHSPTRARAAAGRPFFAQPTEFVCHAACVFTGSLGWLGWGPLGRICLAVVLEAMYVI